MKTSRIELKNLSLVHGKSQLLKSIDLSIKFGSTLALIGENGSGKSSLLRVLSGQLRCTDGKVILSGEQRTLQDRAYLRQVGYLSQYLALDDKLTGFEQLSVSAAVYGLTSSAFKRNLSILSKFLPFEDIAPLPIAKLSGGQKKRIDLARALIHFPKWVFLDEPTSSLDPVVANHFWQGFFSWIRDTGSSAVVSTHSAEEAKMFGSVALLRDGSIHFQGSYSELCSKLSQDIIEVEATKPEMIIQAIQREPSWQTTLFQGASPNTIKLSSPTSTTTMERFIATVPREWWTRISMKSLSLEDILLHRRACS